VVFCKDNYFSVFERKNVEFWCSTLMNCRGISQGGEFAGISSLVGTEK